MKKVSNSIKASACGKAILVGEHAVVYGAKAVALPLKDMRLELEGVPNEESDEINLYIDELKVPAMALMVVYRAFDLLNVKPFPFTGYGKSTLPIGAGLGSSATLCVAILRCLSQVLEKKIEPSMLANLSNKLESLFHGTPSGLDVSVVSHEKPVLFSKEKGAQAIEIGAKKWSFAIINSGKKSSTQKMIEIASSFFNSDNKELIIARFNELADMAIEALKEKDHSKMAEVMNESQSLLDDAGIVTNELRSIISKANSCGCLATKVTGAGGGGALISLLEPGKEDIQKEALKKELSDYDLYFTSI